MLPQDKVAEFLASEEEKLRTFFPEVCALLEEMHSEHNSPEGKADFLLARAEKLTQLARNIRAGERFLALSKKFDL